RSRLSRNVPLNRWTRCDTTPNEDLTPSARQDRRSRSPIRTLPSHGSQNRTSRVTTGVLPAPLGPAIRTRSPRPTTHARSRENGVVGEAIVAELDRRPRGNGQGSERVADGGFGVQGYERTHGGRQAHLDLAERVGERVHRLERRHRDQRHRGEEDSLDPPAA